MSHRRPATPYLAVAALVTGGVSLGIATRPGEPPPRTLSVQGIATVPLSPTTLELSVVVQSKAEIAADALAAFQEARRRAVEAFEELGVEGLTVRGGGSQVHYGKPLGEQEGVNPGRHVAPGVEVLEGTRFWEILTVEVTGIRELDEGGRGAVVASLLDVAADQGVGILGANANPWGNQPPVYSYGGEIPVRYRCDDREALEEEVVSLALADAQRRAEEIARLRGLTPLSVGNVNVQPAVEQHRWRQPNAYYAQHSPNQPSTQTPFGGVLQARASVTYRIE